MRSGCELSFAISASSAHAAPEAGCLFWWDLFADDNPLG